MHVVLDRFEGALALLELVDGSIVTTNTQNLPQDAREGDILCVRNGKWEHDSKTQEQRQAHVHNLMGKVFE